MKKKLDLLPILENKQHLQSSKRGVFRKPNEIFQKLMLPFVFLAIHGSHPAAKKAGLGPIN